MEHYHRLYWILFRVHQYRVKVIYKPGQDLFKGRLAVQKKTTRKTKMQKYLVCTLILMPYKQLPIYQTAWQYRDCNKQPQDEHLQCHQEFIIRHWPEHKNKTPQDMITYWTFQDDMAVIGGVILKGRHVVIPDALERQALEQLHFNHMGIQKSNLLVCESIYWPGMNRDIENHIKKLLYPSWFSANTAKGKNNLPWNPRQTMGSSWGRHVYLTQYILPLYCRLSQQVPCHQKDGTP